jgi:hypothetical protein
MAQATEEPTIKFDIEMLSELALRLAEHADSVLARRDTGADMRLAAKACERLAHLRFEIGEIIGKTKDPDTARELRDSLEEAAKRG